MTTATVASPTPRFGSPAVVAVLACIVCMVAGWPGTLQADSLEQLRQAQLHQFTDWHPPVMALLWSGLLAAHLPPAALLVVHQALFAAGFALFADGCFRVGLRKRAWAIAITSCFPLFIFYNRMVIKDTAMTSALLCSAGILFWFAVQRRVRPFWATSIAVVALAYGLFVRINAVFAIGPLLLLLLPRAGRWKMPTVVAISLLASVVALPVSDVVNHRLIGAHRMDVMQQLQIYDLMGIEARSGDASVWGRYDVPVASARRCYTSVWWDTFSSWGACASLRPSFGELGNDNPPEVIDERSRLWRHAILSHPLAYLKHRVASFNSSLYFVVPAFHSRYKHLAGEPAAIAEAHELKHKIRLDYLKTNVLVWPATWLVIGAVMLVLLRRSPITDERSFYSTMLISSGLLFSLGYFVVGIATDVRYHYWSIVAICVGCLISIDTFWRGVTERSLRGRLALWALVLTVALGYTARLADIPVF